MSILGSIAGGIGSGLVGGLFGGDDEGSTRAKKTQPTGLQKELQKIVGRQLEEGMPEYQGELETKPSQAQQNVSSQINSMLSNNDFGMSQGEMDKRMGQTRDSVNENLQGNFRNTFRNMSDRGLMDSDITGQNLGKAQSEANNSLADAQTNMYLENEQLANQQRDNALSQGMQLSTMQNQQQDNNINRSLEDFYRRQEQPFQNALQVAQGLQLPLQQNNSQVQQQNAQSNAQQESGLWGALGNIGGTVMDNWSQSWF